MKPNAYFFALLLAMCFYASYAQTSYGGKVRTIPGLIEAEDFDLGGEGVGYHDRQTKNPGLGYRPDEAPGIKGMTVSAGKPNWYKFNESTPTKEAVISMFPGDAYVDLVGMDIYKAPVPDFTDNYELLKKLNKTIVVAECGDDIDNQGKRCRTKWKLSKNTVGKPPTLCNGTVGTTQG